MAATEPNALAKKIQEVARILELQNGLNGLGGAHRTTFEKAWNGVIDRKSSALKIYNALVAAANSRQDFVSKNNDGTNKTTLSGTGKAALAELGSETNFIQLAVNVRELQRSSNPTETETRPNNQMLQDGFTGIAHSSQSDEVFQAHPFVFGKEIDASGGVEILKMLMKKFVSGNLRCLIDSSFLQSAGRALKSAAESFTDVQNLIRLIDEIVTRREVYIVLARNGTVYPKSCEIVNLINESANFEVIKIIDGEREINYTVISQKVIGPLITSLPAWFLLLGKGPSHSDILRGGGDANMHSVLVNHSARVSQIDLDNRGAQLLASHVLTHPEVLKVVRNQISIMNRN